MTESWKKKVEKILEDNKVVMFSKSWCPEAKMAKLMLKSWRVDFKVIEVDLEADGKEILAAVTEISSQSSVPNVFVGGWHVGGYEALDRANKNGRMKKLFKEHGVPNALLK